MTPEIITAIFFILITLSYALWVTIGLSKRIKDAKEDERINNKHLQDKVAKLETEVWKLNNPPKYKPKQEVNFNVDKYRIPNKGKAVVLESYYEKIKYMGFCDYSADSYKYKLIVTEPEKEGSIYLEAWEYELSEIKENGG